MKRRRFATWATVAIAASLLGGCASSMGAGSVADPAAQPATLEAPTKTTYALQSLPAPARSLDVAVYEFPDLTGQHKPNIGGNFAPLSRAVTQGGADILTDVLREAGQGEWFDVVERRRLPSLLQERQIIETTRQAAGEESGLQALRFAGILLEGGIVGYDTDETTGGAGARLLGIGGNMQYRRDIVTVALRAVSVQSGRVLASVTTTKTIYSALAQGTIFKFVGVDELLEVDVGFSKNHPTNLAVREAIQLAVYALIHEGVQAGLWNFADPAVASGLITKYTEAKNSGGGFPEFDQSRSEVEAGAAEAVEVAETPSPAPRTRAELTASQQAAIAVPVDSAASDGGDSQPQSTAAPASRQGSQPGAAAQPRSEGTAPGNAAGATPGAAATSRAQSASPVSPGAPTFAGLY